MAKNMARLEEGVVTNIEWHSYGTPEAEDLVDCGDYRVRKGDTYEDGAFYRDGEKLLTDAEAALLKVAEYESLINELYSEVTSE